MRAHVQQHLDDPPVPHLHRHHHGRGTIIIAFVDVGAAVHDHLHDFGLVGVLALSVDQRAGLAARVVQRALVRVVHAVDVQVGVREDELRGFQLAEAAGVHEQRAVARVVRVGGDGARQLVQLVAPGDGVA